MLGFRVQGFKVVPCERGFIVRLVQAVCKAM